MVQSYSYLYEMQRQPIFGNPLIVDSQERPLGFGQSSGLHRWAGAGFVKVGDLWDGQKEDWISRWQLTQRIHRYRYRDQWHTTRTHILTYVPWDLRRPPLLKSGDWLGNFPPEGPHLIYKVENIDPEDGSVEG